MGQGIGRADLAAQLALELQAALDQLKHGTEPNQEIIEKIREEVPQAAWLKLKEVERVRGRVQPFPVQPSQSAAAILATIQTVT